MDRSGVSRILKMIKEGRNVSASVKFTLILYLGE